MIVSLDDGSVMIYVRVDVPLWKIPCTCGCIVDDILLFVVLFDSLHLCGVIDMLLQ